MTEPPVSGFWFDEPDARLRARALLLDGSITAAELAGLDHFVDDGYLVGPPSEQDLCTAVAEDVDRLWAERPAAAVYKSPTAAEIPLARAHPPIDRLPGYALRDLHHQSQPALDLLTSAGLLRLVGTLLARPPVLVHSLFFEWGGALVVGRDVDLRRVEPLPPVLGVVIALDDVGPKSGPPVMCAGSHRDGAGRQEVLFPERGTAVVWHPALSHGDRPLQNADYTRRTLLGWFSAGGESGATPGSTRGSTQRSSSIAS